jgi:EAL domain-containing protein (putative c-di-GMP-specific phosphodiesterase class I)
MAGRLLILDDDEALALSIGSFCEEAGFAAHVTTNAGAFLAHASGWAPTHIVLDLIMPHTDGVEILHELALARCPARIVLMSGADRRVLDAARRSSLEQGLATIGVLSKPFDPDQHPTRGLIAPSGFVPFAESCGLIDAMTQLVVELALKCHAEHPYARDRHIAINLSAKSLVDHRLPDRLLDRCNHYGVNPKNVVLEVTETAAMADPAATVSLATRLRLKGFQLSIDDFGVGYSSFAQLARLPFSELKVDAAFVSEVRRSSESRKIVAAMVGLGHSLGMTVTAEGVRDSETLTFLRNAGCDFAQGYFIGHPVPPEALHIWQAPV